MSRLLIAASRDQMPAVIAELYRHHLFHIEEFVDQGAEGYEGFKIGTPLPGASEASLDLVKIRAISSAVAANADDAEAARPQRSAELKATIERELPALEKEVEILSGKRSRLEAQAKEIEQKIEEIAPFTGAPVDLDLLRGYRGFAVLAGYVARDVAMPVPCEMYIAAGKEKRFMIAVVRTGDRNAAERALQEASFQAVQIPEETGPAQARIVHYSGQIAAIAKELIEIKAKLDAIRKSRTEFLTACEEYLKTQVEATEAPLRFATTKQTFVAEGWVPSDRVDEISGALEKATAGKIYLTVIPTDLEHDEIPVEYSNPDFAKPAQMLMDVYSRPKYTEVDPTLMLAIVFPLFFGFILGDVGYGLILLVMCFGLRKFLKGDEGQMFLKVLRNASLSSILFGLLFSEFLGFALPWSPLIFSRHLNIGGGAHGEGPAIAELMILTIWIGILHITLGRVLGMINHSRQDPGEHRMKAVMANFGWLAVMWGIIIIIWSMFAMPYMLDLTKMPVAAFGIGVGAVMGVILILVGIICIARESALELVELPTIISHVLSYARLMAVGLSSVAIAMVVNYLAIGMFIKPQLANLTVFGVLIIIAGVVIFIVGHALNTALGILGGGLHSIRLHYVEFFTKFYKGGGKKYVPFGMKRRFTEE
jgi:V/A-type H+-transporting ATPase subunit I